MRIVISNTPPYSLDLDAPTLPAYETTDSFGRTLWGRLLQPMRHVALARHR